jgi:hypothetical protein
LFVCLTGKKSRGTTTMSKHRLYFSQRCRFCQAFLEELSTTPFVPMFQLICTDSSPSRPPLPPWLKSVPTLIVAGESEPRVGPGAVNNWLFEAKLGASNPPTAAKSPQAALDERHAPLTPPVYSPDLAPRPTATARTNTATTAAKTEAVDGPLAYYGSEMAAGRWSDNFSFLGDTFTAEKGMNPIERNFQSLLPSGGAFGAAGTPGGGGGGAAVKRSAKEDALIRDFEAYTASRDSDVPTAPTRR